MDGAPDLLVQERGSAESFDPVIGADAELAQDASAGIGVYGREKEVLVGFGPGFDHAALVELEPDALNATAGLDRGVAEADDALGSVLDRPRKNLPVREVVLTGRRLEDPVLDAELEIGALALDVDFAAAFQPLDETAVALGHELPLADRVRPVDEAGPIVEVGVLVEAHF